MSLCLKKTTGMLSKLEKVTRLTIVHIGDSHASMNAKPVGQVVRFS